MTLRFSLLIASVCFVALAGDENGKASETPRTPACLAIPAPPPPRPVKETPRQAQRINIGGQVQAAGPAPRSMIIVRRPPPKPSERVTTEALEPVPTQPFAPPCQTT
jgi:hypothetical protein